MILKEFCCIAAVRLFVFGVLLLFTQPTFSQDLIRLAGIDHVFRDLTNAKSLDLDDFSVFELEEIIAPFVEARQIQQAFVLEHLTAEKMIKLGREKTAAMWANQVAETKRQAKMAEEMIPKIRELIGEERYFQVVLATNLEHLSNVRKFKKQTSDLSFLVHNEPLQQAMGMEPKQIEKIKEISEFYGEWLKKKRDELLQQLDEQNANHFRRVRALLDSDQAKFVDQTLGKPVCWFRLSGEGQLAEQAAAGGMGGGGMMGGMTYNVTKVVKGKPLPVKHYDLIWMKLISEPAIWQEIELTDDQIKQTRGFLDAGKGSGSVLTESRVFDSSKAQERLQQALVGEYELPPQFEEMLLPGQKDWLRQAELQLRLARFRDSFCLYAPQIKDVIKLSAEQKAAIDQILEEMDIEYQKLIADFKTQWREKASLDFNRILAELTEEQNVMYNQSIGFENQSSWFTPLGFERGRPGAGGGHIGSSSAK